MKKYIVYVLGIIAIGLLIFCNNLFFKKAALRRPLMKEERLVIGTQPNFSPFEFKKDGKIVGFEIDLMHAIARRLGKKIEIKDLAFDTLLMEAQYGRIDIIASAMTPTPERSKKLLFTKPYLEKDPLLVITLVSKQNTIKTLQDLKNKIVGVNDGYTAEYYMQKQDGVELKRWATPAETFLALKTGRIDAYVSARSMVQSFFEQHPEEKLHTFELDEYDSYALAVSPLLPDLFDQIQNALQQLSDDGTLSQLKKQWHLDF